MDIIKLTRELGAAIQEDERYLKFTEARIANENDKELMELLGKIQLIQMNFQREAEKGDEADENKLAEYNKDFETLYTQFSENKKVQAFEEARQEVDGMMNYIMGILSLCVNGADPATCEPEEHHHDCDGECSSCGGCH